MERRVLNALQRRLDPSASAPLIVALSGGGDSIALLRRAVTWAKIRGRPILAVTVDHRLHPDSAAWTAFAGTAARSLGCDWRALVWTGPKPNTGLPAAARAARHALIADAAREAGACVILTGHTADDVLEGEIMRTHDVPSLGRLGEWSPSPAWPEGRGVFLLRPLLELRRAALRAWLCERGADWLEDPANDDPRHARARARIALSSSPAERGTLGSSPRVTASPDSIGGWLGTEDRDGGGASHTPTCPLRPGADAPAHLPRSAGEEKEGGVLTGLRGDLSTTALSAALLCAAGSTRPPRGDALARVLARLAAGERFIATLAGGRLDAQAERVLVTREPGERGRGGMLPLPLPLGEAVVWDGRFEITASAPGLTAVALAGHAARLSPTDRRALVPLPPAARASLPVLIDGAGAVSLPAPFGPGSADAYCLVHDRFAAALGAIPDERALSASVRVAVAWRRANAHPILSLAS